MSIVAKFFQILLRYHVYTLFVIVVGQFFVGQWTEFVLDELQNRFSLKDWVLRDVVIQHKLVGNILAIASISMVLLKVWMWWTKPPRPTLSNFSLTGFLIHQHWWVLVILFPAQYLTTSMAGETATWLGAERATVFGAHFYIALAILFFSCTLLLQKLFFIPNAVFRSNAVTKTKLK